MSRDTWTYEGKVRVRDVEPGVGGDQILLDDHPDAEEFDPVALDWEFQRWWGEFICCGPPVGPIRITIEDLGA
jgi:hypothetical protein